MTRKIKPRRLAKKGVHHPPVVPVSKRARPKWPQSHVKIDHSQDAPVALSAAVNTLQRVQGGLDGIPPNTLPRNK
jgi:hypothetical protein